MAHLLTLYSQSKQSDLQQRCLEFLQLAREGPAAMMAVLPVDASCEDVEVCVCVCVFMLCSLFGWGEGVACTRVLLIC